MSAIRELALAKATGGGGGDVIAAMIARDMTEIVIPDGTTEIPSVAFYGCSKVTSLTIPDSVKTIGSGAFSGIGWDNGSTALDVVANGVESIQYTSGSYAFGGAKIKRLVLPAIKEIQGSSFGGCTSIEYIYLGPNCTSIASGAFGGVPVTCKVECGFAEGAVSGFPSSGGWGGNPANLDITYNVAEPSE